MRELLSSIQRDSNTIYFERENLMSLKDLWMMITMHASDNLAGWIIAIIVLASFIQIAPIKINPWTWFWKSIQNALGISELRKEFEEHEAKSARTRILRFSDELENKMWHSEDMFQQAMDDIDEYDKYCENHPGFKNNRGKAAKAHIMEVYQECLKEHKFTKEKKDEQEHMEHRSQKADKP